jgi:hypothetical protein
LTQSINGTSPRNENLPEATLNAHVSNFPSKTAIFFNKICLMLVHKTAIPINEAAKGLPIRVLASVRYEGYGLVGASAPMELIYITA